MDDMHLLRQYARHGSHRAFAELVARHMDWVYGVSLRLMKDAASAEDVTQAVFIVLARKAATLSDHTILAGWLMNTTRYAAADALKRQNRRQRHERQAAAQAPIMVCQSDDQAESAELLARVDAAVQRLRPADRDALVLRFHGQRSMPEVASALGISEEAAKKRVSRALEKLRALMKLKPAALPAAALIALLQPTAAQAAPVGLPAATLAAVTGHGTGSALAIARGAAELMAWAKLKLAAAVAGLCVVTAGGGAGLILPRGERPALTSAPAVAVQPAWSGLPAAAPEPQPQDPPLVLDGGPQFSRSLDRRLLRFQHQGGAFATFHLVTSVLALPGRGTLRADVVVERQASGPVVLVRSTTDGLPYAYLADGLLVRIDPQNPGGLLISEGVWPQVALGAHAQPAATMTAVRVEAAGQPLIDVDLASWIDGMQRGATGRSYDGRFHAVSVSRDVAGGRVRLVPDPLPDRPPVVDCNVSEAARLAITVRDIQVGPEAAALPRLTRAMVERLQLPLRQVPPGAAMGDLLPPERFFDHPQQCAAAVRLRSLLVSPRSSP